jgi:hypothetical protein
MRNRTKIIAAAAVAAALAAGGTTAAAASTGANGATASVSVRCGPGSDLAARLSVSPVRLDQALRAVKTSLSTTGANPTEEQFDAALARALGIPQARMRQAFAAEKSCGAKPVGSKSPAPCHRGSGATKRSQRLHGGGRLRRAGHAAAAPA